MLKSSNSNRPALYSRVTVAVHRVRCNVADAVCAGAAAGAALAHCQGCVQRSGMDCHGPRLAVPCKQPVFKHTPHRDLGACIVSWLTQRHGAQFAARKREVADKLQTLRQAALQGDSSQAGCRALIGYFHCLSALGPALPFGTDEARGQLHVRFEWSSAYKQTERTKAYVPLLECVAVLFNAAASMSAQAAMEAGKRSSSESLKRQC
eukprot:COSAG05_NODE_9224_length_638_cov_0.864564_1_plen_206_part_10